MPEQLDIGTALGRPECTPDPEPARVAATPPAGDPEPLRLFTPAPAPMRGQLTIERQS